jgi:type VI secretion system ImpC/EvpB family protein
MSNQISSEGLSVEVSPDAEQSGAARRFVASGAADARRSPTEPKPVPLSLLDDVVSRTAEAREEAVGSLQRFLNEPSPGRAIRDWLGLSADQPVPGRAEVTARLSRDVARIDELISAQLNAILHHPQFQKLEASWRGLWFLVDGLADGASIKVRVLNISWRELTQDQDRALEFDQSQLFRKVYESEFGHPGGEPFGVLLGDYEIHHRATPDHPFAGDVETLGKIGSVAAAAFAPFIAGVHPSFFGLDQYSELERPLNLPRTFEQIEYLKWRTLRQAEDSRFVGLVLPRVLIRLPYGPRGKLDTGIGFREDVGGEDRSNYLWANAVYAFGSILLRAFAASGWLADIRGVRQGKGEGGMRVCLEDAGLVTGLPVHSFLTDRDGLARKCSTEVIITDEQEKGLDDLGFIPLCHCHDTEYSAFYACPSIQKPAVYDEEAATANARISAMLQYMLCVSRFSHYIKVISRDKVGGMTGPEEVEDYLRQWLRNYITANDSGGPEVKAKYPLREAKVQVRERRDQPGTYQCVIHLRPHYQLEQMRTSLRLSTELAPGRPL